MKLGRTWQAAGLLCLALVASVIALAPPGFAEDLTNGQKTGFVVSEVGKEGSPKTSSNAKEQDILNTACDSTSPEECTTEQGAPMVTLEAAPASFHPSITETLRLMGLNTKDLALWGIKHPTSTLNRLKDFSSEDQKTVAAVVRYIRGTNPKVSPKTAWRVGTALVYYSAKYGIPVHLSAAVAHTESHFNPSAKSPKGAMGIMQVMWRVHTDLLQANGIESKEDMMDPEKGVAAGCLLLSRYVKAYGSIPKALARYYGGSSVAYFRKVNTKMANIKTSMAQ
ncbi:soluble lytic murein transglycosylase-like protein [Thermanaerovibrio velox DSM 12556]|uniref:Soluble lytic murein transglycosylase-like protein n=1 Tax=Thermanaerovibrio velox DSM 12556 TaxID=926567 RepID=H0UMZ5_9BACT|nr:transglycosylase SLT domain-containing protein [Thermanaerovibrio velox]EHM09274.1 soluble lytic murein transglycosylase-like protein [Thermanaerovibrio velox DSM 12556]